jgi:hypothetical protein
MRSATRLIGRFVLEIEIKGRGVQQSTVWPARDPLAVDPKDYSLVLENDQVRVLRVTSGPHNITPLHQHILNRLSVFVSPVYMRVSSEDGTKAEVRSSAGDTSWGGPVTHTELNLTDGTFHVVLIEFKR